MGWLKILITAVAVIGGMGYILSRIAGEEMVIEEVSVPNLNLKYVLEWFSKPEIKELVRNKNARMVVLKESGNKIFTLAVLKDDKILRGLKVFPEQVDQEFLNLFGDKDMLLLR